MSKQIPDYLKLVTEPPLSEERPDEDTEALEGVCRVFGPVTGYELEYVEAKAPTSPNLRWSAPVNPGVGVPPGLLRLLGPEAGASSDGHDERRTLAQISELAGAIGGLWSELLLTRQALWEREAELAAAVPVIEDRHEARRLATRLESVLQGGAKAVNCDAAALYLLDDATSELKLRASWGLPRRRLTAPARPLCDQLADLEAMLGHAVVLEDPMMFGLWRVPETCAACVCVPVSTPTIPLGTLWMFSNQPRGFTDEETNLIEIVAGRIASDLERETLLSEAAAKRRADQNAASSAEHGVES